eukprot:snap_masked-scaffold_14-processed-gene-10.38-mRNA-1 protein AED:1.00 eAED:1.00 QI:0/-1/0/0/-1/1/1/0/266
MMDKSEAKSTNLPTEEFTGPSNPQKDSNEEDQSQNSVKSPPKQSSATKSFSKSLKKSPRKSPRHAGDKVKYKPQDLDNISKIIKKRKRMERIQKDIAEKLAEITAVEERLKNANTSDQSKDNDKSSKATTLDPSRHSPNDDAETRSQVTTLTRRSKASKASGRSEVSRAKSYRSRATDASKTSRKSKYSQPSLKGDKNSSSTLSIDPWSETGSTYVDKKFHTRNYEPQYLPTSSFPLTAGGYPLVHIQPPNKLTALTFEKIKAFVH